MPCRSAATRAALLIISSMLIASASHAGGSNQHYSAAPVTEPTAKRIVVRDLMWRCGSGVCVAGRSNSRPATDCAALVREIGALSSFSVAGRQMSAEDLEKCNRRAR